MNFPLLILRLLAFLMIIPGLFIVLGGAAVGFRNGGVAWFFSIGLIACGVWFVSVPIRFLRHPTVAVATDIVGVASFMVFGTMVRALEKAAPDAWGIPQWLEVAPENARLMHLLLALPVAWLVFRALKKFFAGAMRGEIPAEKAP